MENSAEQEHRPFKLPERLVDKAIKVSCYQMVLGSIAGSLAGGMFLTGFALKLGATNAQIGLMTTVPMFCVVLQMVSSAVVERGISRRAIVTYLSLAWAIVWFLIMAIPYALAGTSAATRITALIALITLASGAGHLSTNARSSWLGDLIPSRRLGEYFGKTMLFSSIVGTVFSIVGGTFLDHMKHADIGAFAWIFAAGATFGLAWALLNLPQADVPVRKHEHSHSMRKMVRAAFGNKPLMLVTALAVVLAMQAIANPFISVYILRDLHVPFVGLGLVTAAATVITLVSSTFWGRMVDKYGCRPVLIACLMITTPIPIGWIWITSPITAYCLLVPMNIIAGFTSAGVSVALSKMLFSVIPEAGRSVQIAVYSIMVYLLTAPLPAIGGHLPDWINSLGIKTDLRCTFYLVPVFLFTGALIARKIPEQDARQTSEFVRNLPKHLTPSGYSGRAR